MIERVSRSLPYSCEQVFDLAADIERYPEYLKGWISSRVKGREPNIVYVEQVLGFGPVRLQFDSKAVLRRPERIDVSSTDPSFRRFSLSWVVAATAPPGCRICVAIELEVQSAFLQCFVDQLLPSAVEDIIKAFEDRAHRLYAAAKLPPEWTAPVSL